MDIKNKSDIYIVVYYTETDGNINIEKQNIKWIKDFIDSHGQTEIAIINGNVLKNFDSKIDLTKL